MPTDFHPEPRHAAAAHPDHRELDRLLRLASILQASQGLRPIEWKHDALTNESRAPLGPGSRIKPRS